jgi:hypothetical protein
MPLSMSLRKYHHTPKYVRNVQDHETEISHGSAFEFYMAQFPTAKRP